MKKGYPIAGLRSVNSLNTMTASAGGQIADRDNPRAPEISAGKMDAITTLPPGGVLTLWMVSAWS